MNPLVVLDCVHDIKLRTFLESQYLKIHVKLGYLFDVFIKDIFVDAEVYDVDNILYKEIHLEFSIIPRPEVVFLSAFVPLEKIPLPLNSKIIRVPPSKKTPFILTRYNLHKLMCPTFHELNSETIVSGTYIKCLVRLYADDVIETPYGAVVRK